MVMTAINLQRHIGPANSRGRTSTELIVYSGHKLVALHEIEIIWPNGAERDRTASAGRQALGN